MRRWPYLPLALSLLLVGGCAGKNRADDGASSPVNHNLLTSAEFNKYGSVYQAVQTLRPGWLRTRAAGDFRSVGQVWVYRDGMRYGGLDRLMAINTVEVDSLRYLDGIAASQRFGLGHENGVIHVFSRVQ